MAFGQPAKPIREINSVGNEGAPNFGCRRQHYVLCLCANEFGDMGPLDRKGYGSCDIFISQKINGVWSKPRNAGTYCKYQPLGKRSLALAAMAKHFIL